MINDDDERKKEGEKARKETGLFVRKQTQPGPKRKQLSPIADLGAWSFYG